LGLYIDELKRKSGILLMEDKEEKESEEVYTNNIKTIRYV
jgi:hypothetical protein